MRYRMVVHRVWVDFFISSWALAIVFVVDDQSPAETSDWVYWSNQEP
jgi:hypothetical protein